MPHVAGHEFEETVQGCRCTRLSFASHLCDMPWLHVRSARREDIGCCGFAHAGALDEREYREIQEFKQKGESLVWQAVIDAAAAP